MTALAEYVALDDAGDELRLTLSNYRGIECQGFKPPAQGQYLVTVTATTPRGQQLSEGEYSWKGENVRTEDGGPPLRSARAVPAVRTMSGNQPLHPGGHVKLTRVELAPFGGISGLLAFEFPGSASRPATSLDGRFNAKLCRFQPRNEGEP